MTTCFDRQGGVNYDYSVFVEISMTTALHIEAVK